MQNQNNNQKPQLSHLMNATIVTGQYTDNQGQQKKSYLTIGTLFVYQDGGMSLKLDALPANGQNIVFYPQKAKGQNPPMQNQANQNNQNQGNQNYGNGQNNQNQYYQGGN
jgi:hypothetical protein